MDKKTLFWDVDTQYDFMMPDGKLYAEGAERIIPVVSDLRAMALDNGCSVVASMDWHSPDNPEISDHPDFKTTFPAHCMAGSPRARRVGNLGKLPADIMDLEVQNPARFAKLVQKRQFHIAIHKQTTNVFSNPNTVGLIEAVAPGRIVVFGVVLEICVQETLRGLTRLFDVPLILVTDATVALDAGSEARVLNELQRMGIELTEFSLLSELAPCG